VTTPPLLLGAAVLFWGWHTRLLVLAIPFALVLESARLARWRWEFSPADFDRLSSATSLLSWGVAGYLFLTTDPSRALTTLIQWLPLLLSLLMLAQAYGGADRVDVTGLFWTIRRRRQRQDGGRRRAMNLSYLFVVICLVAAAAANQRTPWFYAGLCALAAWTLWRVRSPRFRPAVWAGLVLVVVALGYAGHVGLAATQRLIEAKALEWVADLLRGDTDPFRSTTAIGSIGTLKLSDRIVLRVEAPEGQRPPTLLREASYNIYTAPTWLAFDAGFASIPPGGDGTLWTLGPAPPVVSGVTIAAYLRRGRGVLPLPPGTFELRRLTAVNVSRNPLGAVKVGEGLGLSTFEARFGPTGDLGDPPNDLDLRVPPVDAAAFAGIVQELGLAGLAPGQIRDTVAGHFREHFRYSTFSAGGRAPGVSAISDFLFRTRAGHCEYFATATVLLMRAAGVPARYAAGYSVQEWSTLEKRWVVRTRHAHSWALIHVDGAWRAFDTTPPLWAEEEQKLAAFWQPVSDLWSWATFAFARWRWGERGDGLTRYLGWLLIPLFVLLAWRLYFRRKRTRLDPATVRARAARTWAGADSEFYAVEARLDELGLGRRPSEPVSAWIRRIEDARVETVATVPLRDMVSLHYRYRFDPAGLTRPERATLRDQARDWLERHEAVTSLR